MLRIILRTYLHKVLFVSLFWDELIYFMNSLGWRRCSAEQWLINCQLEKVNGRVKGDNCCTDRPNEYWYGKINSIVFLARYNRKTIEKINAELLSMPLVDYLTQKTAQDLKSFGVWDRLCVGAIVCSVYLQKTSIEHTNHTHTSVYHCRIILNTHYTIII